MTPEERLAAALWSMNLHNPLHDPDATAIARRILSADPTIAEDMDAGAALGEVLAGLGDVSHHRGDGATPAEALRALAEKLRR